MKKVPKENKSDIFNKLVKGSLAGVPFVGGVAAEFFELVIKPPHTKRLKEWMESIAEDFEKLKEQVEGFKIEDLANNEMFTTTILHATQVAIRNHQKEKLEALRAAVLNSSSSNAPEENLQLMFLNFVDELTPWHLRILNFFNNPKEWGEKHGINYDLLDLRFGYSSVKVLIKIFPQLLEKQEFCEIIIRDLLSKKLLSGEALDRVLPEDHIFTSSTSDFGKQFIQFITSPFEEVKSNTT
ncbi:MAG: hypothetical protein ISS41_09815 [Candidatus Aminicenantes bacterium]|nr:hypothetical protein [Candidatus Aminicenantes bacterium]MBL7083907.1 hypothetical protein [Candidatus Aminicenantes bacterium]